MKIKPKKVEKETFNKYYCGKCDLRVKKAWTYCPYCGNEIEWEIKK